MIEKAKITSQDLTKERLNKLKELMPDLFNSDGNLNIQSLYDLAHKYSNPKKERYEFN
jgi:adenine-specific DNA-methyltransferase